MSAQDSQSAQKEEDVQVLSKQDAEQHGEQAAEQSSERGTEQPGEQVAEHSSERADRSGEQRIELTEDEKAALRKHTNSRLSHWCACAALIIILISCASYILGKFDIFFIRLGIMASIALLAFAVIKSPSR